MINNRGYQLEADYKKAMSSKRWARVEFINKRGFQTVTEVDTRNPLSFNFNKEYVFVNGVGYQIPFKNIISIT